MTGSYLAGGLAALGVAALSGCGTLPDGHRWGQDVTLAPGLRRVGGAAVQAVRNPDFWAPLLVGGALQIDDWDHRLSGWARRTTPLFGSEANAVLWSDRLRSAAVVAGWGSILLAPSGPLDADWVVDKLKGSAVDVAAAESAIEFTSGLKRLTQRERPNGYDNQSMPSDHTTTSAVYDELAVRNLQLSDITPALRTAADIGLDALTVATGWARVEAGAHFPSDTLVGASVGDYFANFFTDAFLAPNGAHIRLAAVPGGVQLQFGGSF